MRKQHDGDHERVKRWILGLAERQVTANGSRATFTSDMYFEAAESIEMLQAEIARLQAELQEAREIIQRFVDAAWTEPSMSGRNRLMGLGASKYMAVYPDARAFLDKAGK